MPRVSRETAPPADAGKADGARKPGRWLTRWWYRLEPDPRTAPVVRWTFAQRLARQSVARIARALNEAGVPCPSAADPARNTHRSGTSWTLGTVTTILENPRYTGREVWSWQRTDTELADPANVTLEHRRPRVEVAVLAIDDQQAQPAQAVQDRVQRWELAQVELSWLIGRYAGDYGGAFGQDVREGTIGGQDGCRPGAAGPRVMHVDSDAHAELRKPGGFHISMMPGPAPGSRIVFGPPAHTAPRSKQPSVLPSVIDLRRAPATCNRCGTAARLSSGVLAAIRIRRLRVPRVGRGGVLAVFISR